MDKTKIPSVRKSMYIVVAALLLASLAFFAWSLFSKTSSNNNAENTDPATDFIPVEPQEDIDDPTPEGYERDNSYEGLTETDAVAKADEAGISYRIAARDGEHFPLTMDYNPERINFIVEDGIVTRAEFY